MAPEDTSLEVYPDDPAQPTSPSNTSEDVHDETDTESPTPDDKVVLPSGTVEASRSWMRPTVFAIGSILVIMLIASQVYLVTTLNQTQTDLGALETQVANVDVAVSEIADTVSAPTSSGSVTPGASPAPAIPSGFLPRFTDGANDPAVGLALTEIVGTDAYTAEPVTVDPADGTKRIWLIWAHWCPYCQQELPELTDWYPTGLDDLTDAEFVTVTTSIDSSRGNPLDEYLEAGQFPFPVIVDADNKIAAQFGVSAFPFWVITDGQGTVLYRTAGLLPMDQLDQLFIQLDQYDA